MNYWYETVQAALEEVGKLADFTDEQIKDMASVIEGSHENYGMCHDHDCIPNPTIAENTELKQRLKLEQSLVHCRECNGKGRIITNGPYHSSDSQCWKCNGEGKHLP